MNYLYKIKGETMETVEGKVGIAVVDSYGGNEITEACIGMYTTSEIFSKYLWKQIKIKIFCDGTLYEEASGNVIFYESYEKNTGREILSYYLSGSNIEEDLDGYFVGKYNQTIKLEIKEIEGE